MLGTGWGAGVDSTCRVPLPSWKSIETVTTGFGDGETSTVTVRRDGSSSASACWGVASDGTEVVGPCNCPGSVEGQGPVVEKLLVVASRKQ
ncbi:hypothetical protein [Streptomyces sp. NBC_00062]|uniref:hypothetical protein n=1 Tax=Streptomyces sp. NBC_00062 TaxID=2975637 RepID=UPI00225495D2|nr:hypothetical protein [Streptomyces sp. NBC_00062]MCX5430012.1 hypothetical protein [Streptomyces sp. NBC_00062]